MLLLITLLIHDSTRHLTFSLWRYHVRGVFGIHIWSVDQIFGSKNMVLQRCHLAESKLRKRPSFFFLLVNGSHSINFARPIHFCFTRSTINHSWIIHSQEMNGFVVPLVLKGCTRAGWVRSPWRYIAAKVINTPPKPGPFGWQSLVGQHLYLCRLRIWLEIAFLTLAVWTTLGGTRNGYLLAATQGAPEVIWGICLASRTKN